ncbi:MAG: hypothetical protein ACRYHQ_35340 [Janthinobacterium lividum]
MTGVAVNADHGWPAKVLVGDPVVCGILDLARSLTADKWDAFTRSMDRIKTEVLVAEALAALWRECSQAPA